MEIKKKAFRKNNTDLRKQNKQKRPLLYQLLFFSVHHIIIRKMIWNILNFSKENKKHLYFSALSVDACFPSLLCIYVAVVLLASLTFTICCCYHEPFCPPVLCRCSVTRDIQTNGGYVVWTVFPIKWPFLYIHAWCISSPRAIIHMTTLGAKGTGWIFIGSQRAATLWVLLSWLPSLLVFPFPVKAEGILFYSNQMTRIQTRKPNMYLN